MTDLSRYTPVLQTGRWFAQLPPDFVQALLGMARIRHLQTGEVLFLRDGPPCGLYALVRGAIRVSGQGGARHEGREALLVMLEPPSWFGEISVFDGSARTHDAHAAESSTVLQVPHEDLLLWLAAHPCHWQNLAILMADKLRLAFATMEEQTVLPAHLRLARRLVMMAQGYGQANEAAGSRRSLSVTQEQLALMIGVSRQTTNAILNDLKDRKLVAVHRGSLEILDLDGLRALYL
jgi:CRP-like cAMP-binding protein